MGTIRAIHLQQWAGTVDARNQLGELIRRLIHSGLPLEHILIIQFLANEANQLAGWDGLLSCHSKIPWIPDGQSVWELGVGLNERGKVRSDYKTRLTTELPDGWERAETTYVAVSLGKFDARSDFENELKNESPWRDTRIVDAAVLEEWIEQFIGVEAWLQESGVGPVSNIVSLHRYWTDWSAPTEPPISPGLVIVERESEAANLRAKANEEDCFIKIKADSERESLAFAYAALSQDGSLSNENLLSKAIVISNPDDTNRLLTSNQHLVFLVHKAMGRAAALSREGHKVVCALGQSSLSKSVDIVLKRPLRSGFVKALTEMGVEKQKAETEARACGSSVSIWRVWNQLDYGDPSQDLPIWAKPEYADLVVPAVLLGGWSERLDGDKDIIQLFTGREYDDFRDSLQIFLSHDDPLITKIDDAWVVSAPATAFSLIVNNITTGHIETLENAFSKVFQEADPTIDLPPDERPYAALKNATMKHSTWLRDGLAETLLRIVVLGERLEEHNVIPNGRSRQDFVDKNIRDLLGLAEDWRLFASLRNQLPVLAEAGPIPFMAALNRLLQGSPEDVKLIFEEGGDFSGHSFHPNLLWALETLAWEPTYLARVSLLLSKLASIDPGGRLSNRPINSLKEIFLAWHPGTSASLDQRIEVLDLVISKEVEIGWSLIKKLLPTSHGISSPTHEPIWKNFSRSDKKITTRRDVWFAYKAYFQRALKSAGDLAPRWLVLIDVYADVSEEDQLAIEAGLNDLSNKNLSDDDKNLIWSKLRETISRHREYPDAAWSLPDWTITRLESVKENFKPTSLNAQFKWLFDDNFPEIEKPKDDFEEAQKEIDLLRIDAVKKIWLDTGKTGLLDLVRTSQYPDTIAKATMGVISDIIELGRLVVTTASGNQAERLFSSSLSAESLDKFGDAWTDHIFTELTREHLPVDSMITPFIYYPNTKMTYNKIDSMGEDFATEYWQRRPVWVKPDDKEIFIYTIEKLMEYGRSLELISIVGSKKKIIDKKYAYLLLNNVLRELNEGKSLNSVSSGGYWIEKIFQWLRENDVEDIKKLARLEYAFLPILTLTRKKSDLVLHEILANDPRFFVEVLCDLYKPANRKSEHDVEPTEESKNRAHLAWKLLNDWKLPPGVDKDGNVDSRALKDWVLVARGTAEEKDRAAIADQQIGEVLYHMPIDPEDGIWPHVALRDLLEELVCEDIEEGVGLEQYNSRGVVSKAMYEGGAKERAISVQWKDRANFLATRWPRVSALCERISTSWEREAVREDERAEKDRLKHQ